MTLQHRERKREKREERVEGSFIFPKVCHFEGTFSHYSRCGGECAWSKSEKVTRQSVPQAACVPGIRRRDTRGSRHVPSRSSPLSFSHFPARKSSKKYSHLPDSIKVSPFKPESIKI